MFCNIYVKKMCQKWVPKIPKKLILPYKLLYCMKFQIPLFPHPLADFFCSRVIFWDKISYFKRGKGADVLENYALEPKMVQMTQEFRMWGMAGHKRPWWLQMAGYQWILVGSGWDTSSMNSWYHLDPKKIPSGALRGS